MVGRYKFWVFAVDSGHDRGDVGVVGVGVGVVDVV